MAAARLPILRQEDALIFRITHISNVPWVLDNGLHCRTSNILDPSFVEIGNPDLIGRRTVRRVPIPPGGTLSDYIPFYFTPCTPMLLNIKTGYNVPRAWPMSEIAVLVSSLPTVGEVGAQFVFTDRHAYLAPARFSSDLKDLDQIDWKKLQERDFRRDPDDPEPFERYQAEALIYRHLPVEGLMKIGCRDSTSKATIEVEVERRGLKLTVDQRPEWYP